jgi:hypothetical protein
MRRVRQWADEYHRGGVDALKVNDKGVEAEYRVEVKRLQFIDLGKPVQNGSVEGFNARVRDELLNGHAFTNLGQSRAMRRTGSLDFNDERLLNGLRRKEREDRHARLCVRLR